MSNGNCGNCLYQGDTKPKEVLCLVKSEWLNSENTCEHFARFTTNVKKEERTLLAIQLRNRIDANQARKEDLKIKRKYFIFGILAGIVTMIVGTVILKLLFPN